MVEVVGGCVRGERGEEGRGEVGRGEVEGEGRGERGEGGWAGRLVEELRLAAAAWILRREVKVPERLGRKAEERTKKRTSI